jgi:hypothetical protein
LRRRFDDQTIQLVDKPWQCRRQRAATARFAAPHHRPRRRAHSTPSPLCCPAKWRRYGCSRRLGGGCPRLARKPSRRGARRPRGGAGHLRSMPAEAQARAEAAARVANVDWRLAHGGVGRSRTDLLTLAFGVQSLSGRSRSGSLGTPTYQCVAM